MLQYWLSVFVKAFFDSLDFIGQTVHGVSYGVLVVLFTAILLVWKHGWRTALKKFYLIIGEGVLVSLAAFIVIFLLHLIFEPYHLQDDMTKNRHELQDRYDQGQWKYAGCIADLNTEQAKTKLLSERVDSQQQLINHQQGAFSSQQGTMNLCMTTLGVLEKPERQKINAFPIGVVRDRENTAVAPYTTNFVLVTNQIITPVRLIVTCEPGIVQVGGGILGTGATLGGGWGGKFTEKEYGVGILSPAWAPNSPMLLTVYSNQVLQGCHFEEK